MKKVAENPWLETCPIGLWLRVEKLLRAVPFLLAFLWVLPHFASANQYRIARVVDGDTIVVDYQGKYEKVRLLCVNTPESVHRDMKQNTPMGKVASEYTRKRLTGKYVALVFEDTLRGRYGRLLAYVIVDGQNFNLELVRQGLSPYYTKYGLSQRYDRDFAEAEEYARRHELNIWGDPGLRGKYLRLKHKWGLSRSLSILDLQKDVDTGSGTYIGNKRSHKLHRVKCRWAKKIAPGNMVYFKSRQEDAMKQGYIPCKVCNP